MSERIGRQQPCSREQARVRLRHAKLFLQVAETVLAEELGDEATVATGMRCWPRSQRRTPSAA